MSARTRHVLLDVLAALLLVLAVSQVGPAAASQAPQAFRLDHGVTAATYSYANAVRETVWVDTGLDLDGDGTHDRVAADIIRPSEPAAAGQQVPVIMDASPYYSCCGRGNESQVKKYDSAGKPIDFPLFYDNYFVPRGYAVVLVDLAGTNRSQGCVDLGGPSDIGSAKSVVDWLNGRATGYSAKSGGSAVTADWTTGSVGMIGKSWDATIANGVAATGVDGLKTIVPISGISSWYDYYRADGADLNSGAPSGLTSTVESDAAHQDCDAVQQQIDQGSPNSGDDTPFWDQRNYAASAANVKASVFVAHGVNDLNVKTINFGQWWSALPANVEKKIWLSQTGHVDPFDYRRKDWVDTLQRWFDHYLLGVDNGIQTEPQASIERAPDSWQDSPSWPATSTDTTVSLEPGSTAGLGTLGSAAPPAGATESFTDAPNQGESDWVAQPDKASGARVLFSTGALSSDLRVSGTSKITVTATPSASAARLSAVLVDLGPTTERNFEGSGEGIKNLSTRSCWGDSTADDSACYLDTAADPMQTDALVFSRGWADLGHYASLDQRATLTPGTPYTMTFDLATTDHIVPASHQLALVIAGTDADEITGTGGSPKLTIDLTKSSLSVPLVGTLPR